MNRRLHPRRRLRCRAAARVALVALAASAPDARAQNQPSATTPSLGEGERRVLKQVDTTFGHGDRDAFFACFAESAHRRPLALWRHRWQTLGQDAAPLRRTSSPLRTVVLGGQLAAVLDVEYAQPDDPTARSRVQELAVFAAEQPPRLRFLVDIDAGMAQRLDAAGGELRCPPCNLSFRCPQGWFAAPGTETTALCLHSFAAYHPSVDLCLELAAHVAPADRDARALLTETCASLVPASDEALRFVPWTPRFARGQPGAPVDAARTSCELTDGQRVLLCAATHGGLAYLVAVYGAADAFVSLPDEVERALAGFALLEPVTSDATVRSAALAHHTGDGCVTDDVYGNEHYGVVIPLPAGWQHEVRGEHCFTVASTSAGEDGEVRASAHAPPRGFAAWTAVLASRLAALGCRDWMATAVDSGWQHESSESTRRQWIRTDGERQEGVLLVVAPRLLLIVQWRAGTAAAREALGRARQGIVLR